MNPFLRILSVLLLALVCSGCITQRTIVQVNPDGSGVIAVSRIFSAQTVSSIQMTMQQMKNMSLPGDGSVTMNVPDDPFFNEDQFKREARTYGRGVEFLRAQRVDKDGGRGAAILYKFKDINQVRLPFGDDGQMMMGGNMFSMMETELPEEAMEEVMGRDAVLFTFESGEPSRLKVRMPEGMVESMKDAESARAQNSDAAEEDVEDGDAEEQAEMQAMFAQMSAAPVVPGPGAPDMSLMPFDMSDVKSPEDMMKKMFAGLRVSVAVEVKGAVQKSNASLPSAERAGRYTLFDLDFDKLLASGLLDGSLNNMNQMGNPFEAMLSKGAVPGVSVETNELVVIEFK